MRRLILSVHQNRFFSLIPSGYGVSCNFMFHKRVLISFCLFSCTVGWIFVYFYVHFWGTINFKHAHSVKRKIYLCFLLNVELVFIFVHIFCVFGLISTAHSLRLVVICLYAVSLRCHSTRFASLFTILPLGLQLSRLAVRFIFLLPFFAH